MSMVVVRCPGCRGAARVEPRALGVRVACPRCDAPFDAVEEAALVTPGPGWVAPAPPPPPRRHRPFMLPQFVEDYEGDDGDEGDDEGDSDLEEGRGPPPAKPDREHDAEDPGTLPASVLVGLALLPFLIPIIWLLTPLVIGNPPTLTVAAPLALAVATSVLCLAVISTIDWTPATRVKGVLFLVALSYLTSVGLYVLRKEMLDQVKRNFGIEPPWKEFAPAGAGYAVKAPAQSFFSVPEQPLGSVTLACHRATLRGVTGMTTFNVGSSGAPLPIARPQNPAPGSDEWFDSAVEDHVTRAKGKLEGDVKTVTHNGKFPGREFTVQLKDSVVRVVRLFVINGRVYYLSVEALQLDPEDDLVTQFFDSFKAQ